MACLARSTTYSSESNWLCPKMLALSTCCLFDSHQAMFVGLATFCSIAYEVLSVPTLVISSLDLGPVSLCSVLRWSHLIGVGGHPPRMEQCVVPSLVGC